VSQSYLLEPSFDISHLNNVCHIETMDYLTGCDCMYIVVLVTFNPVLRYFMQASVRTIFIMKRAFFKSRGCLV